MSRPTDAAYNAISCIGRRFKVTFTKGVPQNLLPFQIVHHEHRNVSEATNPDGHYQFIA